MPDVKSPSLRRLFQDWEQRRRGRAFPTRSDFDPLDLKYILGDLSLIDVLHDPQRFRMRLHATNVVDRGGIDLTGKFIEDMPDERRRSNMIRHWQQVVADRRPSVVRFNNEYSDQRRWNCEILLLPLSSDGTTVDMLMAAFAWSEPGG
ncbi:MAG TPA: PAS domain-containing protein [Alphaproteobacteria bacterium]